MLDWARLSFKNGAKFAIVDEILKCSVFFGAEHYGGLSFDRSQFDEGFSEHYIYFDCLACPGLWDGIIRHCVTSAVSGLR